MKDMVLIILLCIETAHHHSESTHQPPVAHLYLAKEYPQEHNQACLQSARSSITETTYKKWQHKNRTIKRTSLYDRMLQ